MAEKDLQITSLVGGLNDTDSESELAEDECTLAENVEFFFSSCGERRLGCGPLDLTGSGLTTENRIIYLSQWFPTNKVLEPEFFAVAATPGVSAKWARRSVAGAWGPLVPPDALDLTEDIYQITTQSLNGKLFIAYPSATDRLHVWDGTTLRLSGLSPPPSSGGPSFEGSGTFSGIRYYRYRFVAMSGAMVLRRSEPGANFSVDPTGMGAAGVTVYRPAAVGQGETHWEVEASLDNATYYRIARLSMATASVNDEVAVGVGYAANGTESEAIGLYLPIHSARFLAVEGDRLIMGGHVNDLSKQSLVGWTPVKNDPGFGNDERLPFGPNNTVNLDNYDGGPLTGLATGILGTWYAFKWKRIYKFMRTGNVTKAYENITLSSTSGAIPGSVVVGVDENGAACVFFLDPSMGPSRVGSGGPQAIVGLRETWKSVNLRAGSVVARGVYYADKQQVHWWVATNGSSSPNFKIVLQVTEVQSKKVAGGNGVGRGWSTATGRITEAFCASVFTEIVNIGGVVQVSNRPFIGLTTPDFIQRCDTESTDAGVAYKATIRTRPYLAAGLMSRWGVMTAALLAQAHATSTLVLKFIRDFGKETVDVTTGLAPTGTESHVIKDFDDLSISESRAIQVEISDP